GQTGVPRDLVQALTKVQGVKHAEPLVLGFVLLPKPKPPKDKAPDPDAPGPKDRFVQLVGVQVDPARAAGGGEGQAFIREIEWRTADPERRALELFVLQLRGRPMALVGADLAKKLPEEAARKGTFEVQTESGKPAVVSWVGTVHLADEVQKKLGSHMIFMRLEDAARVTMPGRPNNVTRIGVAFEGGCDREAALQEVREVVGSKGNVRTVEDSNESVRDITKGLQLGFLLGGAGALVVGLFLVYNGLAVNVAERRHDIGILRST